MSLMNVSMNQNGSNYHTHTHLYPDASFESGVVKIQRNREGTLTDFERLACKGLKLPPSNVLDSEDDTSFEQSTLP